MIPHRVFTLLNWWYVFRLLTDTYPKCKEANFDCFVLDGAGFLIMHDDFLVPDITAKTLEYVHITEKEKDVAEDLLQKGYLVKEECRNLEKIQLQNFYKLDIPHSRSVDTLESGFRCKKYQLSSVGGTNAFLGKKVDNVGELCWIGRRRYFLQYVDFKCQKSALKSFVFHSCFL